MEKIKKNVFWLGITSFLTDVSSEMILSLLPLFLTALGAGKGLIGIIEGIANFTASILKAFSGWISDKLKVRKPLVVLGYSLSTLAKPFIALAVNPIQVLVVRFLDRVGKGVRTSPRDALIADSTVPQERGRSFGFHRAFDTAGAVVGTLIASALLFTFAKFTKFPVLNQYRIIFWLSLLPGALSVLTVGTFVKEIRKKEGILPKLETSAYINHDFLLFLFAAGIFELSNFSYAIYILRAADLGVIVALIPIIYLVFNLVYAFVAQPMGILADRVGKKNVLFLGFIIFSIMNFSFGFAPGLVFAWILFIVYGIGMAIAETIPRAYVADLVPENLRGTAYGIYHTVIGLLALPASAIAGILWDSFGKVLGPKIAFSYGGVLSLVAAIFLLFFVPRIKNV